MPASEGHMRPMDVRTALASEGEAERPVSILPPSAASPCASVLPHRCRFRMFKPELSRRTRLQFHTVSWSSSVNLALEPTLSLALARVLGPHCGLCKALGATICCLLRESVLEAVVEPPLLYRAEKRARVAPLVPPAPLAAPPVEAPRDTCGGRLALGIPGLGLSGSRRWIAPRSSTGEGASFIETF